MKFPHLSIRTPFTISLATGIGPVKLIAEKIEILDETDENSPIKFESPKMVKDESQESENDESDLEILETSQNSDSARWTNKNRKRGGWARSHGGVSRWPILDEKIVEWIDSLPNMPSRKGIMEQARLYALELNCGKLRVKKIIHAVF